MKDESGKSVSNTPGVEVNHIFQIEFFLTRVFDQIYHGKGVNDITSEMHANNLFVHLYNLGVVLKIKEVDLNTFHFVSENTNSTHNISVNYSTEGPDQLTMTIRYTEIRNYQKQLRDLHKKIQALKKKIHDTKVRLRNLRKTLATPELERGGLDEMKRELAQSNSLFCRLFAESGVKVNNAPPEYRSIIAKHHDCLRMIEEKSHIVEYPEITKWSTFSLTSPLSSLGLLFDTTERVSADKVSFTPVESSYGDYIYDFFKLTTESLINYNEPLVAPPNTINYDTDITHASYVDFTQSAYDPVLANMPNQQLLLPLMQDLSQYAAYNRTPGLRNGFSDEFYDFVYGPESENLVELLSSIQFNCYHKINALDQEMALAKSLDLFNTKLARQFYMLVTWVYVGTNPTDRVLEHIADVLNWKIIVYEQTSAAKHVFGTGQTPKEIYTMFRTNDHYYYAVPENSNIDALLSSPFKHCAGASLPIHNASFYTALCYCKQPYAMSTLQLHDVYEQNAGQQIMIMNAMYDAFLDNCGILDDQVEVDVFSLLGQWPSQAKIDKTAISSTHKASLLEVGQFLSASTGKYTFPQSGASFKEILQVSKQIVDNLIGDKISEKHQEKKPNKKNQAFLKAGVQDQLQVFADYYFSTVIIYVSQRGSAKGQKWATIQPTTQLGGQRPIIHIAAVYDLQSPESLQDVNNTEACSWMLVQPQSLGTQTTPSLFKDGIKVALNSLLILPRPVTFLITVLNTIWAVTFDKSLYQYYQKNFYFDLILNMTAPEQVQDLYEERKKYNTTELLSVKPNLKYYNLSARNGADYLMDGIFFIQAGADVRVEPVWTQRSTRRLGDEEMRQSLRLNIACPDDKVLLRGTMLYLKHENDPMAGAAYRQGDASDSAIGIVEDFQEIEGGPKEYNSRLYEVDVVVDLYQQREMMIHSTLTQ